MSAAPLNVFVVATEESGDRLGGGLMRALAAACGGDIGFTGVGGDAMEREGLKSLFPAREIAIIGFVEIIRRLKFLRARIRQVADAAIAQRPDVVVIIDSPDFTHRVARQIRRAAPHIPIVDYVSPTVWAWRPGRARAMRRYVDHVLALLPFEPEAHRRLHGPPCTYVGHPLLDEAAQLRPDATEAARRLSDPPVLLVLPGSRRSELRRLMPIFGAAIAKVAANCGALDVVLPTLPHLAPLAAELSRNWSVTPHIVVGEQERRGAFRVARAALVKSGTVTLELAIAGVPMVAAYKVSPIEAAVARRVIHAPTVILANLILHRRAVPEFLLEHCTADKLAAALSPLITDANARADQMTAFTEIDERMSTGGVAPSTRAAEAVLAVVRNRQAAKNPG